MAKDEQTLSDILDQMALKILMVEPGDLSMVGEVLEFSERLIAAPEVQKIPELGEMGKVFKAAMEKIIMGELEDSPENFDLLGQSITQIQEVARKGEASESELSKFSDSLAAIGFKMESSLPTSDSGAETVAATTGPESTGADAAIPDFLQDKDLLAGFIDESFEHLESIEVNILELEQNPEDLDIINNIFRPFHTIKGVSGFLNLKTINELAHTTENLLDDVRNGKHEMDSEVIDVVLSVGDMLKSMVQNIKDTLEQGQEKYQEFDISEYIEMVHTVQGNGSAFSGQPAPQPSAVEKPAEPSPVKQVEAEPEIPEKRIEKSVAPVKTPPKKAAPPAKKSKVGASIKVDIEKLDGLVNAVGELVIMQAMVQQNPLVAKIADPKLTKDFSQLTRITSELQKTAMAMRMVPIRQTFQKMIRLVRDLSKKSGKKVDLIMIGEETEIDRNMVDSIYDPLVHMIRNSVDHGVQVPEERQKLGKSTTGTVTLSAYQKGGYIVIEIEDDGHGLDAVRIRNKAIERGIIQESDNLSDHDLNNLIFMAGFSTVDKITDVSGRGVGMDVVKKAVEKLRGKVEVVSQPGEGSQFIIRLPLTLAIIDGIIVRVGAERYIIPTIAIQESIRPIKENYNTVHGKGETLMVRESLVPIIRLYEVFGVEDACRNPEEAIVVVIENEGRRRALMVDELLGKQEVVIKSLGGYLKDLPGLAGGTILGDGRVGLILDLAGLIASNDGKVTLPTEVGSPEDDAPANA